MAMEKVLTSNNYIYHLLHVMYHIVINRGKLFIFSYNLY